MPSPRMSPVGVSAQACVRGQGPGGTAAGQVTASVTPKTSKKASAFGTFAADWVVVGLLKLFASIDRTCASLATANPWIGMSPLKPPTTVLYETVLVARGESHSMPV